MGERFVAVERRRHHHNAASPLQWSRDRLSVEEEEVVHNTEHTCNRKKGYAKEDS